MAEAEDGSIHPTNGYVFLQGKDDFLSVIQCGMFKGNTRAVFVDKREYTGPLWQQIEDAFQFVLRINLYRMVEEEGLSILKTNQATNRAADQTNQDTNQAIDQVSTKAN